MLKGHGRRDESMSTPWNPNFNGWKDDHISEAAFLWVGYGWRSNSILTSRCILADWKDLVEQEIELENVPFTSTWPPRRLKQQYPSNDIKRSRQAYGSWEKVLLPDEQIAYTLWQSKGSDPSLGSELRSFEFSIGEEVDIEDGYAGPV